MGAAKSELGGVHYLVNNAGIAHDGALWRLSEEAWRGISAAWREISGQKYEVVADYQGLLKSAAIARCAGAKVVVGMKAPREAPRSCAPRP